MLLWFYRSLTYFISPLFWLYQRRAISRGREDARMSVERWGRASQTRPERGRLVWVHTSTTGDSMAVMGLIERLLHEDPNLHVLITTFSSKAGALLRPQLPKRAVHQLLPFEYRPGIARFLRHWRPDLVVWTESELWPSVLDILAQRNVPRVMINGKLTPQSFDTFKRFRRSMRHVFGGFEWAQVQSANSADNFAAFGLARGKIEVVGSVKEGAPKLTFDRDTLNDLRSAIGDRPIWLAGSSHSAEFKAIYKAHRLIRQKFPNMLLLNAPRHPERGAIAVTQAIEAGFSVARRSLSEPIDTKTAVYCCDTMGEMGLWHSLASICFVAGSLCEIQGHNPFEAASFQNAIIHGPNVVNFEAAYGRYDAAGGAILVQDAAELAAGVIRLMQPEIWAGSTHAADAVRADGEAALSKTYDRLAERIGKIQLS